MKPFPQQHVFGCSPFSFCVILIFPFPLLVCRFHQHHHHHLAITKQTSCEPLLETNTTNPTLLKPTIQPNNSLLLQILQSEPSAPPQDVRCFSPSSTNILVSWRPPPTELQNGIITKYAVQYTAIEGDDTTTRQISDIPSQNSQYLLENLEKWTEYRVTVSAHTDVGAGPESLPQVVRTEEDGMFSKATVPVAMIVHLLTCPPFSDTNSVSLAQQSLDRKSTRLNSSHL